MSSVSLARRLPIGAELQEDGVHFRVWAPQAKRVEVLLETEPGAGPQGRAVVLEAELDGYFAGAANGAVAGTRYRLLLDSRGPYPDPASRFQPDGCHGPSEIVDPADFAWHDAAWPGVALPGQIIYELHIGTFTPEGTWEAAARQLPELAKIGVTLVEVMPVNEFVGRFGWGYDGVDLFAPTRLYGRPDDFRRFVDHAHACGLGVILDVVYNHFGPTGNYLGVFSRDYFTGQSKTPWGDAINFDGRNSMPVREFFISNAGYWIDEFHLDGLRLDAVHAIFDESPEHILAAITRRVRLAAGNRKTLVVGENEFQDVRLVRSYEEGGYGLDAVWNDDFHHAARVANTGDNEFYYGDYQGTPQELLSAVRWGFLYQGQWNMRQGCRRGTPTRGLPAARFITFLQNHDQVANSGQGLRAQFLTSPGRHRALTTLLLLSPQTPMLFQGQEFGSTARFLFFADHEVNIAQLVREGRREFLRQFQSLAGPQKRSWFIDPCEAATFESSKLDFSERQRNNDIYTLHKDLIALRRSDAVFAAQEAERIAGAVIGDEALLLRFWGENGDDRLLLLNLGRDLDWQPASEPLVAPPPAAQWELLFSSEDPRYGGSGTGVLDTRQWRIPGHAAIVLRSVPCVVGS